LLPPEVCSLLNPAAIYANNEISLRDVEVYGFDYDYTLAQYADTLHPEIFSAARDILIEHYKYPEGIRKYDYNPSFAIRGLHYDIQKSLLMKIDAFHYVQLGTAYRGLQPVPDEEVIDLYGGTQHIPLYQMSGFYGKGPSIKQFMDIFSLPEMALLSCVVDHFLGHGLEFDQAHLYKDVTDAIRDVHVKGLMYQWIERDMEKYILRGDETFAVLSRLVAHGKQLFLITNSPFSFVDKGMRHMVGADWRQLFDVVIVQADKPSFFTDRRKKLDEKGSLHWDRITRLEKGKIYRQRLLYFVLCAPPTPAPVSAPLPASSAVLEPGCFHLFSSFGAGGAGGLTVRAAIGLLGPSGLRLRWPACFRALGSLLQFVSHKEWIQSLAWGNLFDFLRLTEWRGPRVLYFGDHLYRLLERMQVRGQLDVCGEVGGRCLAAHAQSTPCLPQTYQDAESRQVLAAWMKERQELSCLLNYRVDFTFYPRRTPLQHEAPLWMDQLCTGCMKTPFLGDMAHIR
ncbi:hypothetical protein E2I00_005866, partial [Balaenoptera physalus]